MAVTGCSTADWRARSTTLKYHDEYMRQITTRDYAQQQRGNRISFIRQRHHHGHSYSLRLNATAINTAVQISE